MRSSTEARPHDDRDARPRPRRPRGDVPPPVLVEPAADGPGRRDADMVMDWFGYRLEFSGIDWVGPVLGSIIFFWGGRPFLAGAVSELRARRPGMMLLITMAIVVAYGASLATTFDWLDLEFWWELAALITIMLLGHWLEMKALGQAQSALAALADLLPDEADRIGPGGTIETVAAGCAPRRRRRARTPRRPGAGRRGDRRRRRRARRVDGHRRVASRRQGCGRPRRRRNRLDRLVDPRAGRRGRRRHDARRDPAAGRAGAVVAESRPGAGRPLRRAPLLRRRGGRPGHVRGMGRRRRHQRGDRSAR